MKYANRLTEEEWRELFLFFTEESAKIIRLHIIKNNYSIILEGSIEILDFEGELFIDDDDYELDDFNVRAYNYSENITKIYREYMYKKFGDEYAKDYLLR